MKNEEILKNKITYTIACNAAKVLGLSCVEKGATTFIGYKEEFAIFTSSNTQTKPLQDELAKPCLEPSIHLVISLLKGRPVKEAVDSAIISYNDGIQFWSRKTDIEAPYVLRTLIWNLINLTVIGNHEAIVS